MRAEMARRCAVSMAGGLLVLLLAAGVADARRGLRWDFKGGPDSTDGPEYVRWSWNKNGPGPVRQSAAAAARAKAKVMSYPAFENTADNTSCISEPTEFVAVWNSAKDEDRVRCVSPDIIVRIAAGRAPSSNDTLWGSLTFALSRLSTRPVSFVAFKDAAEKYLRIGNPQSVGAYVNGLFPGNNLTPPNAPYLSWLFPGIKKKSNGVYLLQQLGYPSSAYDASILYTMIVGKRPTTIPSFVPTWENVRLYFNAYMQDYLARIGSNEAFNIPEQVVSGGNGFAGLANLDFATLTSCPAQCTWEDRAFPDLVKDPTDLSTAPVPAVVSNHTFGLPNVCASPIVRDSAGNNIAAGLIATSRLVQAAPTAVAPDDYGCSPAWTKYYISGDYVRTQAAPSPTWTINNATGLAQFSVAFPGFFELCNKYRTTDPLFQAFVREFNKVAPTDYEKQAIVFRAFLMTSCAGNFNPLFSGNAFVYTGTGGVSSGTVHELLLPQIPNAVEQVINGSILGTPAWTFFCLDGSKVCCPTNEPDCVMTSRPVG